MVYRIYAEKKAPYAVEAKALLEEMRSLLDLPELTGLRILNRYDAEGLDEALFRRCVPIVFSEPAVDDIYEEIPQGAHTVFAVEPLPGQFDQRADSAAQCVQFISGGERPMVASAKVYLLSGDLTGAQLEKIKEFLVNPVESREADLDKPSTLTQNHDTPDHVATVEGFITLDEKGLTGLLDTLGLAMDLDDLKFLQTYFKDEEKRDPTITEIRVVDTYWSDHCRHTTFSTHLEDIEIQDEKVKAAYDRYLAARVEVYGEEKAAKRPRTLMDIALSLIHI